MAWTVTPNQFPATPGEAIWMLKEALVAAGWSVARSGTGSGGVYSAAGDAHAPGGPYAGTLDLADAWFELRQPSGASPRRSFLFKLVTANGSDWRIRYSSNGTGFTGGSPSATALPTATDAQALTNDPAGTTSLLYVPTGGSGPGIGAVDIIAGDTTEEFSFFFGCRSGIDYNNYSFPGYETVICLDVLTQAQGADADPAVVGIHFVGDSYQFALPSSAGLIGEMTASQTAGCMRGWYKKGLSGATFTTHPICVWGCQEGAVGTVVPRSMDRMSEGADGETFTTLPVIYWRGGATHTTQRGFKGKSRLFHDAQRRFGGLRLNQDRSRLSIGMLSIPWDGTSIPIY